MKQLKIKQLLIQRGPSLTSKDLSGESKALCFILLCGSLSYIIMIMTTYLCDRFEDKEVQRDMKLVPYKIVNKDGKPYIQVNIKDGDLKVFSPEEISAMILTKMKETAEAYLGKTIKDAVVTVPGIIKHFPFQIDNIYFQSLVSYNC